MVSPCTGLFCLFAFVSQHPQSSRFRHDSVAGPVNTGPRPLTLVKSSAMDNIDQSYYQNVHLPLAEFARAAYMISKAPKNLRDELEASKAFEYWHGKALEWKKDLLESHPEPEEPELLRLNKLARLSRTLVGVMKTLDPSYVAHMETHGKLKNFVNLPGKYFLFDWEHLPFDGHVEELGSSYAYLKEYFAQPSKDRAAKTDPMDLYYHLRDFDMRMQTLFPSTWHDDWDDFVWPTWQ